VRLELGAGLGEKSDLPSSLDERLEIRVGVTFFV
jgi:hypothetical protein